MTKPKGLEIDRRVGIALSVLDPSQKSAVERLIRSVTAFARAAVTPGRVQQLQTSGQPLYMMNASPDLRLVYTTIGETIYVLDVVERATLDHFATRRTGKNSAKGQGGPKRPRSAGRKSPDLVEK